MVELVMRIKHANLNVFPVPGKNIRSKYLSPVTFEKPLKQTLGMNMKRYVLSAAELLNLKTSRSQTGIVLLKNRQRILVTFRLFKDTVDIDDALEEKKDKSVSDLTGIQVIRDVRLIMQTEADEKWESADEEFLGQVSTILMGFATYMKDSTKNLVEFEFQHDGLESSLNVPVNLIWRWGQYMNNLLREEQERKQALKAANSILSPTALTPPSSDSETPGHSRITNNIFQVEPKI